MWSSRLGRALGVLVWGQWGKYLKEKQKWKGSGVEGRLSCSREKHTKHSLPSWPKKDIPYFSNGGAGNRWPACLPAPYYLKWPELLHIAVQVVNCTTPGCYVNGTLRNWATHTHFSFKKKRQTKIICIQVTKVFREKTDNIIFQSVYKNEKKGTWVCVGTVCISGKTHFCPVFIHLWRRKRKETGISLCWSFWTMKKRDAPPPVGSL